MAAAGRRTHKHARREKAHLESGLALGVGLAGDDAGSHGLHELHVLPLLPLQRAGSAETAHARHAAGPTPLGRPPIAWPVAWQMAHGLPPHDALGRCNGRRAQNAGPGRRPPEHRQNAGRAAAQGYLGTGSGHPERPEHRHRAAKALAQAYLGISRGPPMHRRRTLWAQAWGLQSAGRGLSGHRQAAAWEQESGGCQVAGGRGLPGNGR